VDAKIVNDKELKSLQKLCHPLIPHFGNNVVAWNGIWTNCRRKMQWFSIWNSSAVFKKL